MNGFLEGFGAVGAPSIARPEKAAKLAGVKSPDDAGSGRPVSFAMAVRIHRIIVNIPRTEPSVCRRFPNCSATETIATHIVSMQSLCVSGDVITKERGMGGHICAFQHLREPAKCSNNTLDQLESGLRALAERLC